LLFRGESYGWEAQIFRDKDFTIGRRFILREEAAGWAEWMKGEIEFHAIFRRRSNPDALTDALYRASVRDLAAW
jgi:hypothetical protein